MFADGVIQCAKYAFGPNRLHLCGPDMNSEVLAYLQAGATDAGLNNILQSFQTLYPYLQAIAQANQIKDPFDKKVVEAYWLGNELLDNIQPKNFHRHLVDSLQLKKKMNSKNFSYLENKLSQGARMHHSFHVFNIWQRTGHTADTHTLNSLDKCRISSGQVINISGPKITLKTKPLILQASKLAFGPATELIISRQLEENGSFDHLKINDVISVHWGVPCEILNPKQIANLEKYTQLSLQLANQTI